MNRLTRFIAALGCVSFLCFSGHGVSAAGVPTRSPHPNVTTDPGDGGDPPSQFVFQYFEDGQLIRAGESIPALGPNLMGDSVNEYSGTLSFTQTDTSLPGNNALPVMVGRHLDVGIKDPMLALGLFGDWELEIPHLHTLITHAASLPGTARDWYGMDSSGNYNQNRCSQVEVPPQGTGGIGGSPPTPVTPFAWWPGYHMYIPGSGDQTLVGRYYLYGNFPIDPIQPSDGVSYPILTNQRWQISCLPSLANGAGEGFMALSPSGTRYRFDHIAVRAAYDYYPLSGGVTVNRSEVWILPSEVTDRFGNWVHYAYGGDGWAVASITSSDGRAIIFDYLPNTHRIAAVSDGTRTWNYGYAADGSLQTVYQPDGSAWSFALRALQRQWNYLNDPSCLYGIDQSALDTGRYTGTITHPSGAVGSFDLQMVWHGRSNVAGSQAGCDNGSNYVPTYFQSYSLKSKTLSGPGMPAMTWSWDYGPANGSWAPCNGCATTTTVVTTDPQGNRSRNTYGIRFGIDEGLLLSAEDGWDGNATSLRTTSLGYAMTGPFPAYVGAIALGGPSDWASGVFRPKNAQTIYQQGVNFSQQVNQFDSQARPVSTTRSSSLGYSRTDTVTYYDDTTRWVIDQVAATSTNGVEASRTNFDAGTGLPTATYAFGKLAKSYAFNSDGTPASQTDGNGHATTYANFARGIPQDVGFADGTSIHGGVNNLGLITSYTNEAGTQWTYGYDAMGRLASETPPGGDAQSYNAKTLAFVQVPNAEVGIEANHWRQTITQGNAVTVNYFDARWRKRLTTTYDTQDVGGTQRSQSFQFDPYNRTTFASYPARSISDIATSVPGISISYDALGRPTQSIADSELGPLTTAISYLGGFQKQVTNPRGFATTTSFQAFDQPSEAAATTISAPEGVNVTISRDVFGKTGRVNRNGSYNGAQVNADRIYVYDANQLLCKTLDNEVGATIQAMDGANNVTWRAVGLPLGDQASCNLDQVSDSSKVAHAYDARNRLVGTGFGDGSPSIGRSYTADGLPRTVVSNGSTWTYDYNNRRLLTQENLSVAGIAWSLARAYDANGHETTLSYPDGGVVNHTPNALGEPTTIPGYIWPVTRWPDGTIAHFTYWNGIVHDRTENVRGLTSQNSDTTALVDVYQYDENGNVSRIDDDLDGVGPRQMGYDGQDRLTAANAPNMWGSGAYSYDPLDNLRLSIVGGRTSQHNYDTSNRLQTINRNGTYTGYAYDARGNITARGTNGYYVDMGNRLQASVYVEHYSYDGLGRRTVTYRDDGSVIFQMYSQAGQLLFGQRQTGTGTFNTRYVYLDGKLIAEDSNSGRTFVHTDALGSPVAMTDGSTGAIVSRTRYEPYGATAAGTNPDGPGFTGHVNDPGTGLIYMQQRYYDPIAGRFQSLDPVATDANTGAAFNRYLYSNGNPYRYTDPNGANPIALGRLVGLASYELATELGAAELGSYLGGRIYEALHQTDAAGEAPKVSDRNAGSDGTNSGPPVPGDLVGDQSDPRAGPSNSGNRHNSGPLTPDNGGTGNAGKDFDKLTGGTGAPFPGSDNRSKIPGALVGDNGVWIRPGTKNAGDGPRIEIPGNSKKLPETLHY